MTYKLRTIKMNMHIDPTRSGNKPFSITYCSGNATNECWMNTIHCAGITSLSNCDNLTFLNANITFDYSYHRVYHRGIAKKHIQSAHRTVISGGKAQTVTQRLATSMQAFVTMHYIVVLHFSK